MERVTDTPNTIEVYENDIEMHIKLYCEENNIEDLVKINQSQWNGLLIHLRRKCFADRKALLTPGDKQRSYNMVLVNNLCDYYIQLCFKYSKEVSINGFSLFMGLEYETILNWSYNNNAYNENDSIYIKYINIYGDEIEEKASTLRMGIYKKLIRFREESLTDILVSGQKNPMGATVILNSKYNYNMPGVREAKAPSIEQQTPDAIASTYGSAPLLDSKKS